MSTVESRTACDNSKVSSHNPVKLIYYNIYTSEFEGAPKASNGLHNYVLTVRYNCYMNNLKESMVNW